MITVGVRTDRSNFTKRVNYLKILFIGNWVDGAI